MDRFEQRIAEAVNEKLNDGTVEKLIEQYIEKAVSQSSFLDEREMKQIDEFVKMYA